MTLNDLEGHSIGGARLTNGIRRTLFCARLRSFSTDTARQWRSNGVGKVGKVQWAPSAGDLEFQAQKN